MESYLTEYINKRWSIIDFQQELKRLTLLYKQMTKRSIFIYAADFNKGRNGVDVSLVQEDFYTMQDLLRISCDDKIIDIYLETPGGSAEAAEEIANLLHSKYEEVNFVIAGEAKSAGTILALSGDNIYMCETGSLGPIDAQVLIGRGRISAYDYKKWVDTKMQEANTTGRLNPFDAIMIAQISPGEINGILNSLEFAKDLVKDWLEKYKFKYWTVTKTKQETVTPIKKKERAKEVADLLCDHSHWRSHGRSLKIKDLEELLQIENMDDNKSLADVVYRIKTVIRLMFDSSSIYKIFLWNEQYILKNAIQNGNIVHPIPLFSKQPNSTSIEKVDLDILCPKCGKKHHITGYLNKTSEEIRNLKLKICNNINDNDVLVCDNCNFELDLKPIKSDIETKTGKKISFK